MPARSGPQALPSSRATQPSLPAPMENTSPSIVDELRQPMEFDISTSTLKQVASSLSDTAESLEQFPFLKTIGGLMGQVISIIADMRGNSEEWERLGKWSQEILRSLHTKLENSADSLDDSIRQSFENAIRTSKQLVDCARSEQARGLALQVLSHETDKDLQASFRQVLDGMFDTLQLDLASTIMVKTAQIDRKVGNIHDSHELERLEKHTVRGAEWSYNLGCLPGTREHILAEIREWIQEPLAMSDSPPIGYLCGIAGLKKTSISHSISQWLHDEGLLGAGFFFSRDDPSGRRYGLDDVFLAIAYNLANNYQAYGQQLGLSLAGSIPATPDQQFRPNHGSTLTSSGSVSPDIDDPETALNTMYFALLSQAYDSLPRRRLKEVFSAVLT
ncbi:hypothetical protein GLOTRDRAFT_129684 [Gloeophyllum trabeum ATCC 11539]|uniref:Uncharacterized protein n=1 Tax=Gloeophyllum trabeum (strain ATCC 11539 / FP-39264 / Madison 617) TaxID=670483 RepID=S7RLY5_GLOTA|nr:uncharacterized protein GLOTRDRAFT_129684 [Gloeophyllum trabeum ATCC 11539]EPQ55410.1 hypothetical protein GLOTRDRAFT_129684 [Gloeophyllum trabeum ATCC 11539]